ncbi:unnamed protein product, partial [Prunus brigantina]
SPIQGAWVRNPLWFQGFDAAGPPHEGEAPLAFLLGFPSEAEHWAGLFPRFWVSDTLFYSDQLACFRQAAGSSLPVAFLTKYLDALTNIGFPKQTTVFSKALGHVLSLSLSC